MLGHIVNANRFERSVPDVQRDLCERSDLRDFFQHCWCEMEPGGWRCNGTALSGIDCLISLTIFTRNAGRSLDVWWQRRRSDLREHVVKRIYTMKTNATQLWSGFVE